MRILITGGCGFLGSNLAASFLRKGYEVFIIDSMERLGSENNLNWLKSIDLKDKLIFHKINIVNTEKVQLFFQNYSKFDYICHLAGQVAMTTSIKNPRKDIETNVTGTFNILEAMREYSSDALLAFSSTNKVYGDLEWIDIVENESRYCLKN